MTARPKGWLFGPGPDLLIGCGAAYLLLAVAHLSLGDLLARSVPGGVLILLFSLPHYGATLLRVYESSQDRSRYRFFALHATLALVALFVVSLHSALLGSLVLTLYLTWSPWHYTGQNYGIALMLLARRGVEVTPATKLWIRGSFVASYGLTFFAMHGAQPGAAYAPVNYAGATVQLLPLGIPFGVASLAMGVLLLGYGVALAVAGFKLLRAGSTRALGPAALLVLTQAVWFSLPVMLRLSGAVVAQPGAASPLSSYGFLWVASAHAAQYLWIRVYYATAGQSGRGKAAFLGKAALAGFSVWILPGLIFAPQLLGGMTYDSGLALMVASVVNLHHFVLDGAIWKLRDGRVARVLLRSSPASDSSDSSASFDSFDSAEEGAGVASRSLRGPIGRWSLAVAGAASIAIAGVGFWESEFGFGRALARGDLDRAEQAVERFAWIGRDGAAKRNRIARELAGQAEYERAARQLERSLELEPGAEAHHFLGLVREYQERWKEARIQYQEALAIEPERTTTLGRLAVVYLEIGEPARAAELLARAIERDPTDEESRTLMLRARLALRAQRDESALE